MASDDQFWPSYDPGMTSHYQLITSFDHLLQVVGTNYHQYDQLKDPCKKMVTFRDYSASCNFSQWQVCLT